MKLVLRFLVEGTTITITKIIPVTVNGDPLVIERTTGFYGG